jgi:hypothetical protein
MAMSKGPDKAPLLQILPGYTKNPGEKALLQNPKCAASGRTAALRTGILQYDGTVNEDPWGRILTLHWWNLGSNYPEGFGAGRVRVINQHLDIVQVQVKSNEYQNSLRIDR